MPAFNRVVGSGLFVDSDHVLVPEFDFEHWLSSATGNNRSEVSAFEVGYVIEQLIGQLGNQVFKCHLDIVLRDESYGGEHPALGCKVLVIGVAFLQAMILDIPPAGLG